MGKFNRTKKGGFARIEDVIFTIALILGVALFLLIASMSIHQIIQKFYPTDEIHAPLPQGSIKLNGLTTPVFEDEGGRYTNIQVEECWHEDWSEEKICDRGIYKVYIENE